MIRDVEIWSDEAERREMATTRKAIILITFTFLIFSLAAALFASVYAAGSTDRETGLSIEVVEEIPASDIEESEVPLAAMPDPSADRNARHIVLASAALFMSAFYIIYTRRFEKRIAVLREQAVEAESAYIRRRAKC